MGGTGVSYTLAQLALHAGAELRGPAELEIAGVGSLTGATSSEISFVSESKFLPGLAGTAAAAVMLTAEMAEGVERPVLVCDSPYLAYAKVSQLFDRTPTLPEGVHPSAVVHEDAEVAGSARIGPLVVIERDAVVASGAQIGAGSVVGERSQVGEGTRLFANVTLYQDVVLGRHCTVHSGAVLGGDGFGFAPAGGGWERIAQNGGVRIGDGVSIGVNTAVDRGAIGDTVIEDGVIIDNLCQIAHNVHIGRSTAIAATCGFAGSARLGAHCIFAGGSGTVGHVDIADGVQVMGRTRVTNSIAEPGSWSSGTPMMPTRKWKRAAVRFSQLEQLARRVAKLEKNCAD